VGFSPRTPSTRPSTSQGGLPGGRRGVEDDDEEGCDGAEEQGNQKPKKAAAMLRLREAGVDQALSSPPDVIPRLGEGENHAQMVARSASPERSAVFVPRVLYRDRRGGLVRDSARWVKALKVES
jgi:hypothetical protein